MQIITKKKAPHHRMQCKQQTNLCSSNRRFRCFIRSSNYIFIIKFNNFTCWCFKFFFHEKSPFLSFINTKTYYHELPCYNNYFFDSKQLFIPQNMPYCANNKYTKLLLLQYPLHSYCIARNCTYMIKLSIELPNH